MNNRPGKIKNCRVPTIKSKIQMAAEASERIVVTICNEGRNATTEQTRASHNIG